MHRFPPAFFPSLTLAAALALGGCSPKDAQPRADSGIAYYTCPMHPSVRQSKPGPCPICGMDLVSVKKQPAAQPESSGAPAAEHEGHASPTPPAPTGHEGHSAEAPPAPGGAATSETSTIHIPPERLQAIGVRTGVVRKESLKRSLRAPGIVVIDESTLVDINVKTADGYIEQLHADYTGKPVRKGEPLALILSEGWIEAQQDYINAYRSWRRTKVLAAANNSIRLQQEIERMRARLRVWDLTEDQIKKLEDFALHVTDADLSLRRGQGQGLSGFFELLSPINGIVLEKTAVEGMKYETGQTLFRLAKIDPIWVDAEFPEDQSPYVALGQEFDITFPALPGKTAKARVSFIYPQLNAETRRLKARFVLANKDEKLLPGMYANAAGQTSFGERLAVPFDAVIPTGERFVVFLDHGGGRLEPRFIQVGEKMGDSYEVTGGLKEGDRVITSANFLIDSESRIQGALKAWGDGTGTGAGKGAPVDPHAGHGPAK